jgi:hypothetical protein
MDTAHLPLCISILPPGTDPSSPLLRVVSRRRGRRPAEMVLWELTLREAAEWKEHKPLRRCYRECCEGGERSSWPLRGVRRGAELARTRSSGSKKEQQPQSSTEMGMILDLVLDMKRRRRDVQLADNHPSRIIISSPAAGHVVGEKRASGDLGPFGDVMCGLRGMRQNEPSNGISELELSHWFTRDSVVSYSVVPPDVVVDYGMEESESEF